MGRGWEKNVSRWTRTKMVGLVLRGAVTLDVSGVFFRKVFHGDVPSRLGFPMIQN